MTDFTGIKCPVCGKPFTRADDIVVCPECGAPYHRACYKQVGHCIYEEKHGTKEAWNPPTQEKESVRCPQCGHRNPPGTLVCEHCGTPLSRGDQNPFPPYGVGQNPQQPSMNSGGPGSQGMPGAGPWGYGMPGNGPMPFVFDPMGGVDPESTIDGVKAGDLAKVVQSNTTYYLPVFLRYERQRKNRFNGAAFVLTGAWLLYRKQYLLGTIITIFELALHFLWNYIDAAVLLPIISKALDSSGSATLSSFSQTQMDALYQYVGQMPPGEKFLFLVPMLILLCLVILHIVFGIIGNRCYRKHCVKLVHQIQEKISDSGEWLIAYQERGGVNSLYVFLVFICYLVLTSLPTMLL